MRMRRVLCGVGLGVLAAVSARADCHDAKDNRLAACRKPYVAYKIFWGLQPVAGEHPSGEVKPLKDLLMTDVRLTQPKPDNPDDYVETAGRDNVYAALEAMKTNATYRIDKAAEASHVKLYFGVFTKQTVPSMGQLKWEATVTRGGESQQETVTAVVVQTTDATPLWKIIALHFER